MTDFASHPAVRRVHERGPLRPAAPPQRLAASELRRLCLEAGADDVGFVEVERAGLEAERAEVARWFPATRTYASFVRRMNREPIRSPARSLANLEFHHGVDAVEETAHAIVAALERRGVRAVNPAVGFPMEMDRFGERTWVVAHKPVAVAAGLGHMGIHRSVIHPRFGSFVLLGTVLLDAELDEYSQPLAYEPCLTCKLCVAACPVGAIGPSGAFDFAACYTHNYREFMGGFVDWTHQLADSSSAQEYADRVDDRETVSLWQSLAFGPNYRAAYCVAVCPAGEDVLGPFVADRAGFVQQVVRPLQEKPEPVFVVPDSDAEDHVRRRFPHKTVRRVHNGLGRPRNAAGFLRGLPLLFQRGRAKGVAATYHFTFTGEESLRATVVIRHQELTVADGHQGSADLSIVADSRTWSGFLASRRSLPWALLRRKVRLRGKPALLRAFARCFPS